MDDLPALEWRTVLDLWIPGDPLPEPRARVLARMDGKGRVTTRVHRSRSADAWKTLIALHARPHIPISLLSGPTAVEMDFVFSRPKSLHSKRHPSGLLPKAGRPDVDNLAKCVLDTLTELWFWRDDGVVTQSTQRKWYASRDGSSGMRVQIATIDL